MSSMTFSAKRLTYTPPDKGSFPLDHEGVCKDFMKKYMKCLDKYENENTKCRQEIKEYLDCRMNNELMAKEPWPKLGFPENEELKQVEKNLKRN